ncbi:hypothetical protein AB0910_24410 [Streptomyces sp. NPDC047002]|uniref:hypothetical protein n=1 Tax=Streptomyces sp. NPDC047002 TaxID=3155475 RepID=UPI0034544528
MDEATVRRHRRSLAAFAERSGFDLTDVYVEEGPGQRLVVWAGLIADCRAEQVADVLVPSYEHLHRSADLAHFMRGELAEAIRGTVWVTDPRGPEARHDD